MLIAPSVLSLDYTQFKEQVDALNRNADWLHFDVMDGHFVPNLTFGPDILKAFKRSSELFMDVHLMITDPFYYAPIFVSAGADMITFHLEAVEENRINEMIDLIHSLHAKAGISIKPNTPVETLIPFLSKVDMVLIMSVEPGFGGQSFCESAIDKISYLNKARQENTYSYLIEVDGGINDKTIISVNAVGCDVAVAGSYVFKASIKERIDSLRDACLGV